MQLKPAAVPWTYLHNINDIADRSSATSNIHTFPYHTIKRALREYMIHTKVATFRAEVNSADNTT